MIKIAATLAFTATFTGLAQQPQNPSPMVEHAREHPRLVQQTPPGRRAQIQLGTLFLPEALRVRSKARLLFFFHGGAWLPEVAVARQKNLAVVSIQAAAGSASYANLFTDPSRFPQLIAEAESKAGRRFSEVELGGWSAGCGAIRQILQDAGAYGRVQRVLCIDGIHTDYENGKPGPWESSLDAGRLQVYVQFARDAIDRKKWFIMTHSEIFPGTFASTTETADYLATQLHLQPRAILKWGPMRTQILSEIRKGDLLIVGFAGNSAPDHVDQLHSLPTYLRWLNSGLPSWTR